MDAILEKEDKGKFQSIKNLFKSDSSPKVFVVRTLKDEHVEVSVYAKYKDAEREFKNIIGSNTKVKMCFRKNDYQVFSSTPYLCDCRIDDGTKVTLEEKQLIGG